MNDKNNLLSKIYKLDFLDNFHDYGNHHVWRYQHRQRIFYIKSIIESSLKNECMLDAGCGKGPITYLAMNHFKKIYSFDYSSDELIKAKNNISSLTKKTYKKEGNYVEQNYELKNISFNTFDIQNIPLENNTIDFAICTEVIEHIPNEKLGMDELYRILKQDGKLLISMPNKLSYYWFSIKISTKFSKKNFIRKILRKKLLNDDEMKIDWEMARHWKYSPSKIRKLAKQSNFKIVEKRGVSIIPMSNNTLAKLQKHPTVFRFIDKLDNLLSMKLPFFCTSYFLMLEKVD